MKEFSHPAQEEAATDLNRAIQSTITVASNEWKYVADIELDLDANLPAVHCSPAEFNQVVLNIVVNAAHAISDVVDARRRESCWRGGRQCWRFLTRRRLLMRNRIDIDPKHSRAIVQEIGERLHAFLKEETELPGSVRAQIDRLRELEEQPPSIIPSAERWDKLHREPPRTAQTARPNMDAQCHR